MQYTADTVIAVYTSYERFRVLRRLSMNRNAYCGEEGTLNLRVIAQTKPFADSSDHTLFVSFVVRIVCVYIPIYSIIYRNLDLVYIGS